MIDSQKVKAFLDKQVVKHNQPGFVSDDPISIVKRFKNKEDIEITAFLISIIAWGNRKSIIKSGERIVQIMENTPHQFILEYESQALSFVHRTFNAYDLDFFFRSLKNIYLNHGGLESAFDSSLPTKERIISFRELFLQVEHEKRSEKHLANPDKGSSAKRINMFLRWMVRSDDNGVDFGLWTDHKMSDLFVPLDVHTSRAARYLGLISRKQDDWKSLEELMAHLRSFDSEDPCKYDFALFGMSVSNEF